MLKPGDETPSTEPLVDEKKVLVDPMMDEGIGYVLNVLIYRAQDILATHGLSSLDPFVSVRFNGNQTLPSRRSQENGFLFVLQSYNTTRSTR